MLLLSCGQSMLHAKPMTCDPAWTPIVFLHGFLASGDTYSGQVVRFTGQGYCPGHLRVFDWNTLGGTARNAAGRLDAFIDRVLSETGSTHVFLVGHSAGGGLGYAYLADSTRTAKVLKYVHIGSGAQAGPAGGKNPVPTLNIYSEADLVVPGKEIPGAENLRLKDQDHYQVATSRETFEAMFRFFYPNRNLREILPSHTPILRGRVLSLGENLPQPNARIAVFGLDSQSGNRQGTSPLTVITTDSLGNWGPWVAPRSLPLEFQVETGKAGERPVHYYREGFTDANPLVYLRTLPTPGTMAGLLLAALPAGTDQGVYALFSSSRAIVHGRDILLADGRELSSPTLCPASKTVISMFLYDDGDQNTSLVAHKTFQGMRSFLTGVDWFAPLSDESSLRLSFNGRALNLPRSALPGQGIRVAVFD